MRTWKPLLLGIVVTAASCVQILGDHPYSGEEQGSTKPCNTDADCSDDNECTTDTCSAQNLCVNAASPDGPLPGQVAGDCKRVDCASGVAITEYDDADKPDDNEPCTVDTCANGMPTNTPLMDDQPCQRGEEVGVCKTGVCTVACSPQAPCNDDNPCTDDYCNPATNTCVFTSLDGQPTPGAVQAVGDCKINLCVSGVDSVINDGGDLPIDGNSCTADVCTAGMPSNPAEQAGTYCTPGQPNVCDGNSKCVECVVAGDCTGIVETDCMKRSCVANKCTPQFLGQNVTAALQTQGDCQKNVCNGVNGGTVPVADDTDLPNDNNPCTTDTCMNGMPALLDVPQGTSCGGANVCNATGDCVGCNAPTDCPGTDDFCKARTCTNNVCGFGYTPPNTPLPAGSQIAMDCKVVTCDGAGKTATKVDTTDVPPDDGNQCTKNQCTVAGTPTYPYEPIGAICNQSGGNVCNGNGACKKGNGKTCATGSECLTGVCADGVCCNTTCTGTCKACNLPVSLGTCTNVPAGMEDVPLCSGTGLTCDGAGTCKKKNNQTCGTSADCLSGNCVDGVCCDSACTGTCYACNNPGAFGTCSAIPLDFVDNYPVNACSANGLACNGAGSCKLADGQPCSGNSDCASGYCPFGVCVKF